MAGQAMGGGQPFNVNQASAQALQGAMQGTAQGQTFSAPNYMTQYTNPFTQQVTQNAIGNMNDARQMTLNQIGAQASGMGAFGGSRHGLVEAQANKDFMRQAGELGATMNLQNYNQALQNARADQQLRLGAANQMGNMSNLGFGQGQAINKQMLTQGAMQQALQQQLMDRAQSQYGQFQDFPFQALQNYSSVLSGTPAGSMQTTTGPGAPRPGMLDYLGVGAQAAGALGWSPFASAGAAAAAPAAGTIGATMLPSGAMAAGGGAAGAAGGFGAAMGAAAPWLAGGLLLGSAFDLF